MTYQLAYRLQYLTLFILYLSLLHLQLCTTATPITTTSTLSSPPPSQLYEGDESKYVVGVLPDSTIQHDEETEKVRRIIMTGKNGVKLECFVPDSSLQQSMGGVPSYLTKRIKQPTPSTHPYTTETAQNLILSDMARQKPTTTTTLPFKQQLTTSFSEGCFEKVIDYWTYKVCSGRNVEQYHRTTNGNKVEKSMVSTLGYYGSQGDEDYTTDSKRAQPYYIQHYTKGDNNRQTLVKYICDPGVQLSSQHPQHVLLMVKEPQTYHYEATIHTSYMCDLHKQAGTAGKDSSRTQRRLGYKQRQSSTDLTAAAAATTPTDSDDTSHTHGDLGKALDLLRPLAEDPNCLQLTPSGEWWHYHFCYLESVNQVHTEQVALPPPATTTTTSPATPPQPTYEIQTLAEYDLGHWPKNIGQAYLDNTEHYRWLLEHSSIVKGKTPSESYMKQTYVDGTKCDIGENQHREVEVRFYCPLQHHEGGNPTPQQYPVAAITSVKESSSCRYLMRVDTTLLCEHPTFAPKKPVLHHIVCQPYKPEQ